MDLGRVLFDRLQSLLFTEYNKAMQFTVHVYIMHHEEQDKKSYIN